ncbi:MAG: glycosyltransferase family 4 protein [Anaerolineaceae bacterium]
MKIILFANTAWYLYNFRLPLAQALKAKGFEVVMVSPPDEYAEKIQESGFRWLAMPFSRRGMNFMTEMGTIIKLTGLYRREKPDAVHHFTIKCVLYGSISAKLTGISAIINSITGLGYVFINKRGLASLLRQPVKIFYRLALTHTRVIFQNSDDRDYFVQSGLVQPLQCSLIRGSGVDIKKFQVTAEPTGDALVVLPGRMLYDKGVKEFVEAARILRQGGSSARFILVGDIDLENPASVSEQTILDWEKEGVVEWWRWQKDMPAVYGQALVVSLPSYREGVPKTLLEAAASGRVIVATNVPGCREVVKDGITGLLVPAKDSQILAEKLKLMLENPDLRRNMAREARRLVENEFSSNLVIQETIKVYSSILDQRGAE